MEFERLDLGAKCGFIKTYIYLHRFILSGFHIEGLDISELKDTR